MLFGLLVIVNAATSAKILGIFPTPSISHQKVYQPILRELSLRGHQMTVLSPNPMRDPNLTNLTEIDLSSLYQFVRSGNSTSYLPLRNAPFQSLWMRNDLINLLFEELVLSRVGQFINQPGDYDLILLETHILLTYSFACRFRAPIIGVSSYPLYMPGHDAVGNPTHPAVSPDQLLPFNEDLGFYQKVFSTFFNLFLQVYHHWHIVPSSDNIMRSHFGPDCPYFGSILKNVSLMLVSSNWFLHPIRPNVPAIVEIGQLHLDAKKALPEDLQEYLDNSPQGVVYFSLGSNVKSVNLTENVRQVILEALSELPYNVLWKWESDHLPGKPDNVMTRQWLPQQDLLGHKNIKVFVTQGGLQSMEEAIANGVPLVGMPFFADQPLNVMKMVKLGIGVGLDYATMTKDELKNAILEVAQNNKYKEKINELRDLLQDQPMSGLDKAIWWIEYVIRHKGAKHLRSPAVDMPWWEYYLLDVIAFLLACFIVIMYINYLILRLIWRRIFRRNSQKTKVN